MYMILAVAVGGALGAVLRYGCNVMALHFLGSGFPWATLFVNIFGSFAMGVLIAAFASLGNPSPEMRAFLTVGFLGALTTFSTFALDVSVLWEKGDVLYTALYVSSSVILSIFALFAGMALTRGFVS